MVTVPASLRALYKEGRLIPFVGAGVSLSVTWDGGNRHGVSWSALVDEAARQLGHDPNLLRSRGTDLQILEYFRLKTGEDGLMTLRDWFRESMSPPDDALLASPILQALVKMDRCRTVYTTNYDNFIERALELAGKSYNRITIEEDQVRKYIDDPNSTSVDVVKFHGDLNLPSKMVMSENDYDGRMKFLTMEDKRFQSDLVARALLFVGYSFRDYNVSYLFRTINEGWGRLPESSDGKRAFILLPDPSDFEHRLFRSRNIEIVPVDSLNPTGSVAEALEHIVA